MADKLKVRNVSPLLQAIRNFLLGRTHTVEGGSLRYTFRVSARDQPPPNLPDGEAHKLSANHYCKRDGRREAEHPVPIFEAGAVKQITSGEGKVAEKKPVTPGKYWELSQPFRWGPDQEQRQQS